MASSADSDLGMLCVALLQPLQAELFARLAERGHDALRPCHGLVLAHLGGDGLRLIDLARLTGQAKQYVGRLVDELEELGYVRRRPDPNDRRSKRVVPTARGRREQRDAARILAAIESRHAERIGQARYAAFRETLEDLVAPGPT